MNNKAKKFLKNFTYSLMSNLISMIISTLIILIFPKILGVQEYGYWQLYLFYTSYVGFLHFGWNDGVYLKYGGIEYNKLDKDLLSSQFYMLFISQNIIALGLIIISYFYIENVDRLFILIMTSFNLVILNIRTMLVYILQCTNRIKEYANVIIVDRIVFIILIGIFIFFGNPNYKFFVYSDTLGKLLSLLLAMLFCKEIVFIRFSKLYINIRETIDNIKIGIKLMFANIASMLIIGTVRFGIERTWDVSTFGKVSLTLSISNFMMIFINALGLIMFPLLRRTNEKKLSLIYLTFREPLMAVLFAILILYYPLKQVLSLWLPSFSQSLHYMAFLFPIFINEGKMSILINTYLKTLRKEKVMLIINLITFFISVIVTIFSTFVLRNLSLSILSITILLTFRSTFAELVLAKYLKLNIYKNVITEITLISLFIILSWNLNNYNFIFLYIIIYIIYLALNRKSILKSIKNTLLLIKR